ncbi:MAG: FecR domain-containing protein [Duganella sp.]
MSGMPAAPDAANTAAHADPCDEHALRKQAVAWCALLCSGTATDDDRAAWRQWHQQHPAHQRAWQRLEAVRAMFETIPPRIGAPLLQAPTSSRRHALRALALLASGGTLGYAVYRGAGTDGNYGAPWQATLALMAQYRTGVGQQRRIELADGSLCTLNTDSAVDVHFGPGARTLLLRAGEILVETARARGAEAAPDSRPFIVETEQGAIEALGTRFTVRRHDATTEVVVLEHAVAVRPRLGNAGDQPLIVHAGERVDFNAQQASPVQAADDSAALWRDGSIVVDNWPLSRLVAELARYRRGRLVCDSAVARLRVSGAFPVPDTDQALAVLARSLPLRVRTFTRYWVSIGPV